MLPVAEDLEAQGQRARRYPGAAGADGRPIEIDAGGGVAEADFLAREHRAVGADQLIERQVLRAGDVSPPEAGPRLRLDPLKPAPRAGVEQLRRTRFQRGEHVRLRTDPCALEACR